jgi:hypothetical protein
VSGRDDHDATPKATLLTYIVLPWWAFSDVVGNERNPTFPSNIQICRVARWFIFKPKITIWVNFRGLCYERCWNILWPFSLYYDHLIYFVVIWYILWSFGIYFQFWYVVLKTSGNPGWNVICFLHWKEDLKPFWKINILCRFDTEFASQCP